ncbi:MAG TPA: hypothetical protein PLM53_05855 [Spirochaetota bacterium]|nr:hypothetical protein [Spirochaetota bacterium]HPC42366.1 hypothetical protein [Spirochaetota bacterium]HPL16416.1 hypothetical protein [Spirochaetota bacterium]HQF08045.1 hypothetical protein [Spirochaetota bacterium]HQH96605.1 hypothetical protein [Spirochaetota bacterium]
MKKHIVITAAAVILVMAFGWGCKKKGEGMEDFSGALNMQYESYRIIKDNRDNPARAGKLFTAYYKKNRDAMAAAFKRYYRKYGDGSQLTKEETDFLDGEMRKVNDLLSDAEIRKVMDDPAFIEEAREGSGILTGIREGAK